MQLARRYSEIARRGGEVIFIACEEKDLAGLQKTRRARKPPFPVVMDGAMGALGIGKAYRQRSAFIVDREGNVAWSFRGSTHVRPKGDTILRAFIRHRLKSTAAVKTENLLAQLESGEETQRAEAALFLGSLETLPPAALSGLEKLLAAKSEEARGWAIFALAALSGDARAGEQAARLLVGALKDSAAANRLAAIDALRELGNPFNDWRGRHADRSVLKPVRTELEAAWKRLQRDDPDGSVRSAAKAALADLKKFFRAG